MKMTTRGLPIIGDTTDLSWVGRDDYEQMLIDYGLKPFRRLHKSLFESGYNTFDNKVVALATPRLGNPEEVCYRGLFLQLLLDLAIKGHWLRGWSRDVMYPITNQANEHKTSWVYPEHLREPNE
jgi:hypothetical protein